MRPYGHFFSAYQEMDTSMIPTTYIPSGSATNPTHAGVERVAAGAASVVASVTRRGARRTVGTGLIAVGTMAAVTVAERALDASHAGFTAELIILSAVAVLAFVALRAFVIPALRLCSRALRGYKAYALRSAEETKFFESARRDPRIMNDLLAAQGRHAQFVDEAPLRSVKLTASAPVRDPLTVVAPWVTLARFH
jgi:hypothetical protein